MNHCEECKWSERYFRGFLCNWVSDNGLPCLPAYLQITGVGYAGLESSYPFHLDKIDYGSRCMTFEIKGE